MFIIRWLRWLWGWVRWEAEGGFHERLLNLTARDHITLWGVQRQGERLWASCPAKQYRRLRGPARRTGMRLHVTERHGLPFWARRHRARAGVAVGLVLFIVIVQLFSQRIWVVQVRGNDRVEEEELLTVMAELGVVEGNDLSGLDINDLQLEALQRLPELAWCTVNLKGSVAYIDVDERVPRPDLSTEGAPSNIKATRDGRILSVEAYTGQAMVQKGDAVTKGMLLVSGVVESTAGPILRRAQGRVLAETTHTITIEVPLSETQWLPTGEEIRRAYLRLFSLEIPLFTSGDITAPATLTESSHDLTANGVALPIGVRSQCYALQRETLVERTPAEAQTLAEQQLAAREGEELAGVEVVLRTLDGQLVDGRYVLTGTYTCHENIGVEEPLLIEGS